jgi:hypothetical protein
MNHPVQMGSYVSANSPEVIDEYGFGWVYNAHMDGDKLRGEAWLDQKILSEQFPTTLDRLNRHEVIEVSIGVFNEEEETSGEFNGVPYIGIARNHRGDHLAFLDEGVIGACSVEDGCGVRVNKKNTQPNNQKGEQLNIKDNVLALLKEGFTTFHINQEGFREVMDLIQNKLNSMDDGTKYHYLVDCFSNDFVYAVRSNREDILYKQNYSIANDNSIVFNGDAIKVKRDVDYIEVNKLEVNKMADEKKCKGCPAKVLALIANTQTPYEEKDQEFLNTLEEDKLDQLLSMARTMQTNSENIKTLQTNAEKPVTITKEQILAACAGLTKEEYLAFAPAEYREQFENGLKMQANKKAEVITKITANSKVFTKEELDSKSLGDLEKMASLISEPVDYSGRLGGGSFSTNSESAIPVLLPGNIEIQ